MSNNVMCENCAHTSVCKHQAEFAEIQKQLDNFRVNIDVSDKTSVGPIKSFDYIEVPRLKCKNFLDRVYTSKRSIAK